MVKPIGCVICANRKEHQQILDAMLDHLRILNPNSPVMKDLQKKFSDAGSMVKVFIDASQYDEYMPKLTEALNECATPGYAFFDHAAAHNPRCDYGFWGVPKKVESVTTATPILVKPPEPSQKATEAPREPGMPQPKAEVHPPAEPKPEPTSEAKEEKPGVSVLPKLKKNAPEDDGKRRLSGLAAKED